MEKREFLCRQFCHKMVINKGNCSCEEENLNVHYSLTFIISLDMSLIVAAISGTLINLLIACITSVDFLSEPANRTIPRTKVLFLNSVKLHLNIFVNYSR